MGAWVGAAVGAWVGAAVGAGVGVVIDPTDSVVFVLLTEKKKYHVHVLGKLAFILSFWIDTLPWPQG